MAKAARRSQIRLLGVTGRKRADLLVGTALQATTLLVLAMPAWAQPAPNARPAGGAVVAGTATITQSTATTTIDQTSQRAAINWQSFNVGGAQTVTFAQPSSSAVALNRVTGPDPSQIAGRVDANGQVVLVNQAGVTFYKGAQVNAQSLIVGSANVTNQNFMAGKLAFSQAGSPNASVVNQGTITVKQAGLAALVAPNVANSGVINAQLGHVVLAGAKTTTLDLYGDGLLALDVTNQVTQVPVGPGGTKVAALVTNSGVIRADGGTVQLTARAADGVLRNLVQAGGTVTANSVGARTGSVTVAGIGGSVTVTGLLSASGQAVNTMGGQVAVNATGAVTLASAARIDASGMAGGGTVAVGTTSQRAAGGPGTPATMTAANVVVRKGASITASATGAGNGGRVALLSGGTTRMGGSIAATGGSLSGNGGFVEVSGGNLNPTGAVDVAAAHGNPGTILLDPTNLAIVASVGPSGVDGEFVANAGTSTLAFSAPDKGSPPSTVATTTLTSFGANGTVVVQATGTIDVQVGVTVANALTMQAGGNLTVEPAASISAGGNVLLQAGAVPPGGTVTPGAALLINGDVTTTGTLVQLMAGSGGIALNGNVAVKPPISLLLLGTVDLNTTGGGITQAPAVGITATVLRSSSGVAGNAGLVGVNAVGTLAGFAVTASGAVPANFQLTDTAALAVGGAVSAPGNVYVQSSAAGGIVIQATGAIATGPGGLASFQADAFQIITNAAPGGTITAGTFELAPFTLHQDVTLGTGSSGLVLASLAGINASDIRYGAVTGPGASGATTTAAGIVVNGNFNALNRSLELDADNGVVGTTGTLLNVGTLSGTTGDWILPLNNTVTTIGNIVASSFSLNDVIGLTIAGTLNASTNAMISDTGNLSVAGTVSSPAITLSADNINIPGLVTDGGTGTTGLTANTGTISETGTIISGVLYGSAIGAADFLGATGSVNQVATLTAPSAPDLFGAVNFVAGSFALRDGSALTVANTLSATASPGQVYLSSTAPGGITIAAGAVVTASVSNGTASLQTDRFVNHATVTANTIELAPATAGGTVTLGATGGGLSLASMTGLAATNLLIGAVTQPNALAPTVSAGSIAVAGAFAYTGSGTLTLDAASSTAGGASGAVTQTAALTGVPVLSGTANSFTLTNPGNLITVLFNLAATTGDLSVVSGSPMVPDGVSAAAGNVYLAAAGGVTLAGGVTAQGRVGIETDSLTFDGGDVSAATFELSPITPGGIVTLGGASEGLVLPSLTGIAAGTVRIGAVTLPGGTAPTITAGAVTISATFNAAATTMLELDASTAGGGSGAISQSAPLTNVATLAATGASVVLTTAGNTIGASSGITATTGNIELVDSVSLALNGTYSGGNLFFEVAAQGGSLTIGASGPATLTSGAGARVSLVADSLSANVAGSIGNAGGTVELAPFSSITVNVAGGSGGMPLSAALLADINVGNGTLLIGGFTDLPFGATAPSAAAGAIALNGAVNLSGRVGTLNLLAYGSITEPGGPLTVGTVTGAAGGGDFSLSNPANQIQASTGMTAIGGNVVLVDDPTLQLAGLYSGNNLFFQVTQAGGSLALGAAAAPATLVAAINGRISLVADSMTATPASSITANFGTIELAPFSAINESVLGSNGSGQLLINATLLSDITGASSAPNTLLIGGYTNVPANATAPAASASGVTLDGALNLTGQANTLELLSNGSVTETVGPLTVTNVQGSSVGTFSLANPANAITQSSGIAASKGDVVLVDGVSLTLTGTQSGDNLFFEVAAKAGTLQVGGFQLSTEIVAASGGRVTLVADRMTENDQSSVIAPAGTVELAPFSAINTSLLGSSATGQLLIDPTMLAIITPGISTLVVGGFTNVPAGGSAAAASAASVTVDGTVTLAPLATTLALLASGSVSQSAPLTNVGTLAAAGTSVVLTNLGNTIGGSSGITATAGNIELVDATSLALNGTYSGNDLFFEVASKGGSLAIGAGGPATLTAGPADRISLVADGITANVAGSIGNTGGTVELAPFSAINVSLGGGGAGMQIGGALLADINVGGGTLLVGGFTNLPIGATTPTVTAGSIALNGAVDLGGRVGTLDLLANGSITEPGGPLTVGTVTGAAGGGDFSLSNPANQIQASTGMTATGGNVVLVDDPTLQLAGLYSGTNLFFQVTQAGGSLALGTAEAPATLVAAMNGRISLVADSMTATDASSITAPSGTIELAPFSAINESVLGSNGSGQLLIGPTLLSDITGASSAPATLLIGGYSNVAGNATTPAASASGVTLDGALNLTNQANTLELLSNGSVTETAGPVAVTNVQGNSVGTFSLANPANAITQSSGITASNGDVVLVDGVSLALVGQHSGNNLFFEVATQGGTLQIGTSDQSTAITAAAGGRITLVADQMTENGYSTVTAPAGTVELAPFSAINTSLLGSSATGLLLIGPTLLSIITPGISTLVVGGFTNVPAGAASSTPSAASVTVDGTVTLAPIATTLNFEAIGAVSQSAPIVNVGTLLGTTGSTTLANGNNSVATLGDFVAGNGFVLTDATNLAIAGAVAAGPSANFIMSGALTETGSITASRLSGSAVGTASLTGGNSIAELNGFAVSGNFSGFALNDTGNLLVSGVLSATRIGVAVPLSQISLADGTAIMTGGNVRPSGLTAPPALLPRNGAAGAWFQAAGFTQVGHATIADPAGGPSSLQISVTGNIQFDPHLGLSGNGTWLTLNLTNGSAVGNIVVSALDVSYSRPGSADLFGSINGVIGSPAASLGHIQPAPDPRYLFNDCEIATVVCGITSLTAPPLLNETAIFVPVDGLLPINIPALVLDPTDNEDLLQLPVVSRGDY